MMTLLKSLKVYLFQKLNFILMLLSKIIKKNSKEVVLRGTNREPSENEMGEFLLKLVNLPNKPVILHTHSQYCDTFILNYKPPERAKLFVEKHTIKEYVEKHKHTIKRSQSLLWHEMRTGRITASIVDNVLKTNLSSPAIFLTKKICEISKLSNTSVPSLKWGIDNENQAIIDYNNNNNKFYNPPITGYG